MKKKLLKKIEETNKYIEQANKDEVWAIDCESTWESCYIYEPIVYNDRFIYIKYKDVHEKESFKSRFNVNNEDQIEGLLYNLGQIKKEIKKGYRNEGKELVLNAKETATIN